MPPLTRRKVFGVFFVGLGIVMASARGGRLLPVLWYLVVPGFVLILAGAILASRFDAGHRNRKVAGGTSRDGELPQAASTLAHGEYFLGEFRSATNTLADSSLADLLDRDVAFDLSAEFRRYRSEMRTAVRMRQAAYAIIAFPSLMIILLGVKQSSPFLLGMGVAFAVFAVLLFMGIRTVWRAADQMTVGPSGITVHMVPAIDVRLSWASPTFGVKIIETSAAVQQTIEPDATGPRYRLFTGQGSGVCKNPRVLTDIPDQCAKLIMAHAERLGLSVRPRQEGNPGTVSARVVLTITR